MKERSKRNLIIGILCCLLVFMGVGFAVMNATLNIDGTATAINTWDVRMTKVEVIEKSDGTTNKEETKINEDGISANFKTDFTKPGDFITYKVTIENKGSIDAVLNDISVTLNVSEADKNLFNITDTRPNNQLLEAGTSTTFTIKVEFRSDANRMPSGDIEYVVKVDYSQKSEGEVITPSKTCEADEINLAGECFHIMYEDDTTYTLLAKYNLLVGNIVVINEDFGPQSVTLIDETVEGYGLQSSDAKAAVLDNTTWTGTIAFIDTDASKKKYESCTGYGCYYGYWHDIANNGLLGIYGTNYPADVYDSNSKLYGYVEIYESYLKGKGYNSIEARLMTHKEAEELGCVGSDQNCLGAPEWIYTTTYWLGSASSSNDIYTIFSNANFPATAFDNFYWAGIRPVITILKSEV